MRFGSPKKEAGFTLMELIIVIVVVGVLSAYAMMNNGSASVFSLLSQAQTMASDIRHAQALATVWGKRLRIDATEGANGVYAVSCVTAGASPCDASPVINPATGEAFRVTLEKGVELTGPSSALVLSSLGQPTAATTQTYVLTTQGNSVNLNVAAVTGHVTVVVP
jgi:prepilin-type N-terminal cleavage/methylation domain-containing protein